MKLPTKYLYTLTRREVAPCDDLVIWVHYMVTVDRRVSHDIVAVVMDGEEVGNIVVSTVFTGIDLSFGHGSPLVFDTAVFGGPLDGMQYPCYTYDGAQKAHAMVLERVRGNKLFSIMSQFGVH